MKCETCSRRQRNYGPATPYLAGIFYCMRKRTWLNRKERAEERICDALAEEKVDWPWG